LAACFGRAGAPESVRRRFPGGQRATHARASGVTLAADGDECPARLSMDLIGTATTTNGTPLRPTPMILALCAALPPRRPRRSWARAPSRPLRAAVSAPARAFIGSAEFQSRTNGLYITLLYYTILQYRK